MNSIALYNGEQVPFAQPLPGTLNRAFSFGDGVFETMRFGENKLLFESDHFERLQHGCAALGLKLPEWFDEGFLRDTVHRITRLNSLDSARVRLTVWRDGAGFYQPDTDSVQWLMTAMPVNQGIYTADQEGLSAVIYPENRKTTDILSNIKTIGSNIYIVASLFAKQHGCEESVILNTHGRVAEASSSNIFIRKGDLYLTPPLYEGCLNGVMRKNVINIMQKYNLQIKEEPLTTDQLMNADEVLVTNVVTGIRRLNRIGEKVFTGDSCRQLVSFLNRAIF